MPKPLHITELLQINPNWELKTSESGRYHYIDDFYTSIDLIEEYIDNQFVLNWKDESHRNRQEYETRNFKDYYDCRIEEYNTHHDLHERFKLDLVAANPTAFSTRRFKEDRNIISFNVFSDITGDLGDNIQQFPHFDRDLINVIISIDKISKGGTALYYSSEYFENTEYIDLRCDISNCQILEIIPSIRNRAVLFDGNFLHGAYIEKDTYLYSKGNWRMNQILFL